MGLKPLFWHHDGQTVTTIMDVMASVRLEHNTRNFHGLAVTLVRAITIGYGWVLTAIMAVVAMSRCEQEILVISSFHRQAMMDITTVIFIVVQYKRLHEIVVFFVMAIIGHYGQDVISFTVVTLSVDFLVSSRRIHSLAMTIIMAMIIRTSLNSWIFAPSILPE